MRAVAMRRCEAAAWRQVQRAHLLLWELVQFVDEHARLRELVVWESCGRQQLRKHGASRDLDADVSRSEAHLPNLAESAPSARQRPHARGTSVHAAVLHTQPHARHPLYLGLAPPSDAQDDGVRRAACGVRLRVTVRFKLRLRSGAFRRAREKYVTSVTSVTSVTTVTTSTSWRERSVTSVTPVTTSTSWRVRSVTSITSVASVTRVTRARLLHKGDGGREQLRL